MYKRPVQRINALTKSSAGFKRPRKLSQKTTGSVISHSETSCVNHGQMSSTEYSDENSTPAVSKTSLPPPTALAKRKPFPVSVFKPPSLKTRIESQSLKAKFKPPTATNRASNMGMTAPSPPVRSFYFTCLYTKVSKKKKKKWQDGIVIFTPKKKCVVKDMTGKDVAQCPTSFSIVEVGQEIAVGYYDVELVAKFCSEEFTSGRIFMNVTEKATRSNGAESSLKTGSEFKLPGGGVQRKKSIDLTPAHDPNAANALVLCPGIPGRSAPVVVSPFLCDWLRPHQRDGVQFMYDCVLGRKNTGGFGCLLADEMGLGKTLQSIALVWTLLKQSERGGSLIPTIRRALIVTPSSLVMNWSKEFIKWLSKIRCDPIAITKHGKEAKALVEDFTYGSSKVRPVMIISYEMAVKYIDLIRKADVGLLICDEAHRLKNSSGNKTINALRSIRTSRRVLLTGTPIQNKLEEFFAMADFCNPSVLQDLATFKRIYQGPIEAGRDKKASASEKALGTERSNQLSEFTKEFVLRRSAELLRAFLPPKTNMTVFCKLSPEQMTLYRHITSSYAVKNLANGSSGFASISTGPLEVIQHLTKLCNHPALLSDHMQPNAEIGVDRFGRKQWDTEQSYFVGMKDVSEEFRRQNSEQDCRSSKFIVVKQLLLSLRTGESQDRIVIVSQFTKTLELVSTMCAKEGWPCLQLDGSTPQDKRQGLVDTFNSPHSDTFVFLLSAKAGGAGLNLIGANRLVMYDPCWNPAIDQQAMARVWRDGQKKEVFIYRLLSTGTVEERIFQRQMLKQEYAGTVAVSNAADTGQGSENRRHFNGDELKQLFLPPVDTRCHTYDLIQNMQNGKAMASKEGCAGRGDNLFADYRGPEDIHDEVFRLKLETTLKDIVTFVHVTVDQMKRE